MTEDKAEIADVRKLLQMSDKATAKLMKKGDVSPVESKLAMLAGHRIYFTEKANEMRYFEYPSAVSLSGNIVSATWTLSDYGGYDVNLELSKEFVGKFAALTAANIDRNLGFFMGRTCVFNPVIKSEVSSSKLTISASLMKPEAKLLKAQFLCKYAPVSVISRIIEEKKLEKKVLK